jgi:hypothetical protein
MKSVESDSPTGKVDNSIDATRILNKNDMLSWIDCLQAETWAGSKKDGSTEELLSKEPCGALPVQGSCATIISTAWWK